VAGSRSRRTVRGYALALEAACYLACARAALVLIAFRHIAAYCTRGPRRTLAAGEARERALRDVRWAVAAAAARLPGKTVCFPRALAAQAMLRRRGVATTMTYGARSRSEQLEAHVWLTAGNEGVVGHDVAAEYAPLATYPGAPPDA
jgi:hypothetical protein